MFVFKKLHIFPRNFQTLLHNNIDENNKLFDLIENIILDFRKTLPKKAQKAFDTLENTIVEYILINYFDEFMSNKKDINPDIYIIIAAKAAEKFHITKDENINIIRECAIKKRKSYSKSI